MRKPSAVIFLFLCLFLSCSAAFAGSGAWQLIAHPNKYEKLIDEIRSMVNKDYAPVGLSITDNKVYVLYTKDDFLKISKWILRAYKSFEKYKKELSERMNNGFVPTCLSYADNAIFVLYVKGEKSVDGWRSVPSEIKAESIEQAMGKYTGKGYIPVGITTIENKFLTLMARFPGQSMIGWSIRPYSLKKAQIDQGISKWMKKGYVPWGFLQRSRKVNVLFVGLKRTKKEVGPSTGSPAKTRPKPAKQLSGNEINDFLSEDP
jgi:hypothetical protein